MAKPHELAEPTAIFAALAEILYSAADSAEVYAAICSAAVELVPGCDHASLMLRQGNSTVTVAASDDFAAFADDLERATGEGPCIDALETETPQLEPDLRSPTLWTEFARKAVSETPIRSAMGFRLLVDRRKLGALNLFSDMPGAFSEEMADPAIVLASFASVAVTALSRGENSESLRKGLTNSREIGQAIGLLMALHQVSDDEAFAALVQTSQNMNVKVAELAHKVVAEHRSTCD
ncbi:GAF and ANTAR domain-containing protein [Rhodococcus sp. MS16]|uniref:GAF and ANTAR domain-containing protein n=1 Tax=Rhodococcus sp. MS16 TaxID=2579941 RepID=UPI0015625FBB|nr:GAF and ANTAR domain-containing protein [Rhodococcus sp. MS16]NRI69845.1 GAF and ANTAR domain-containing protein [Rhodococcus sp. MS16]